MRDKVDIKTYIKSCLVNIAGVDLYILDLDLLNECSDLFIENLSNDELYKAFKILKIKRKKLYILRKGVLRLILSEYLRKPCGNIEFFKNKYGKLYLMSDPTLYLNLSHSGRYYAIAISKHREVGVDIQVIKDNISMDSIIKVIGNEEEIDYISNSIGFEKKERFFRVWSAKEAVSKLLGYGLSMNVQGFSVLSNVIKYKLITINLVYETIDDKYVYALAVEEDKVAGS